MYRRIWRRHFLLWSQPHGTAAPSLRNFLLYVIFSTLIAGNANATSSAIWRHSSQKIFDSADDNFRLPYAPSTSLAYEPMDIVSRREFSRRSRSMPAQFEVTQRHPIHILFPLPDEIGSVAFNPFGITTELVRPVIDEALVEVYRRQLVPTSSVATHYADTKLSDAHGPNVAINQLWNNKLDCIIGYAFVYAMAIVARMTPFWVDMDSKGIPVITTIGLTTNLDNKDEYKFLTRISSPYKVMARMMMEYFETFNWHKMAYVFHDPRYGLVDGSQLPPGECYLLMSSIFQVLSKLHQQEHNNFNFNELHHDRLRKKLRDTLRRASHVANGKSHSAINSSFLHCTGVGRLVY
jgi:hypothetical protein